LNDMCGTRSAHRHLSSLGVALASPMTINVGCQARSIPQGICNARRQSWVRVVGSGSS
jgi:hypothetical protein